MSLTFNHTVAREIANGGFAQKVPLPSSPSSNQLAFQHSAVQAAVVSLSSSAVTYTVPLPKSALIVGVKLLLSTAFSASSTVALGSAASGVDILAATAATAQFNDLPLLSVIPGSSADGQTVFVTIGGAPAAGAGKLVIEYLNQ